MSAPNLCSNPFLADNGEEWGSLGPVGGVRDPAPAVPTVEDPSPHYAWRQHNTATVAGAYLPQCPVTTGHVYHFSAVSQIVEVAAAGVDRHRIEVDWYDASSGFLGHVDGTWLETYPGAEPRRVPGEFTAPPGAVRANVLARINAVRDSNSWAVRAAIYVDLTEHPDYTPEEPGWSFPPPSVPGSERLPGAPHSPSSGA